ncbi:MAG: hypothetical protein ACYC9J_14070 [Sulfuricaulis sp.]
MSALFRTIMLTLSLFLYISLAGCASVPIVKPEIPPNANAATILIYHEPASTYNDHGISAYFGEGEKNYASLYRSEYAEIRVAAGLHKFNVFKRGSPSSEFDVDVKPNTQTCIKVYEDPAKLVEAAIPIVSALTRFFKAEVVSCPDEQFLKAYSKADST